MIFTSLSPDLCPTRLDIGLEVTTGFQSLTILSLLSIEKRIKYFIVNVERLNYTYLPVAKRLKVAEEQWSKHLTPQSNLNT